MISIGTKIVTLKGETDCDDNDQERHALPGEVGKVWHISFGRRETLRMYHVTFEPSQVWVVLYDKEINDPEQYTILEAI